MSCDRRTFLKASVAAAGLGVGLAVPSDAAENPKGEAMIDFTRRIPVRHEVDVFVAGGGPAGLAAAVAAARQGRKVFLAERHTCLGGMGTAGMVPVFMQFTDGVNFLAGGIGREVADKLARASGFPLRDGLPIKAEVLKRLYDALLAEAGVDFTFETLLIGAEKDAPDRVGHAVLAAKSGLFAVKAKVFVDATGDGDLAAWAGAPFEKGDKDGGLMPGTLCSLWANIDWETVRKSGLGAGESRLEAAFRDKVFTIEDRHLPGMWQVGDDIGGGNIGHTFGVDSTDERSVTKALLWGRQSLLEYERYYKQYLKGFEKMTLVATGSLLGIRESRRILGDYVLCLDDFKKRAVFPDEIGRYSYPVDIHASKPDEANYKQFAEEFKTLRYGKGESYGIPYRVLVPRKLSNVLVAGRCVSSDRYIQGSIRVMPGCFITGQAAGVAAALAVEKGTDTRGVPVSELQARLKKLGAYLPNC
ncbi:MAG TPA: FAD-dependent oxidoreductase [Planctomycetota bacterium]|nr:FAD-dependent oxidoreductase [Planctomycetota bacterium]HRR78893.1 FAD-dependent oxidoreductase [Planctomycetota bacterium]HRT93904.1 FAD-dependent oxidoreductase [Planctomycetota bacterium]